MLNVAIIGLGIGAQHALAVIENEKCALLHLCDLDLKKAKKFQNTHGGGNVRLSSFDEIINDDAVDLISIASFDGDHYRHVISALEKNKHVFVEKPLCQNAPQLENIVKTFSRKNCGLTSNLVLRSSELFQYLKNLIQENSLGEIYSFEGDYLYGRLHKITQGWRKNIENYSVMEGGGIHMIDLMVTLTGQKPTTVIALKNKIVTRNTAFKHHDFHIALFHFASGLVGKITANFGCTHPHQHVVRIYGTKGSFIYDDQGARIYWHREEDSAPEPLPHKPKPEKKGLLIHHFIDMITHNNLKEPAQREFDLMSIVLGADQALTAQKPVIISYLT